MRTEGTGLDMVQFRARAKSEGNSCQSQEVAEANQMNTLGPAGLEPALEIFTNGKYTYCFTGKADP